MSPTMDEARETVAETFPMIDAISDEDLRDGVVDAWARALIDNELDDVRSVQWYPPTQRERELGDVPLVDHVRNVAELATVLTRRLSDRRDVDVSADLVIAGALVHDVSKVYEFSGREPTRIHDLLGHPYYGVASVARSGLPPEVAHVVLSHSSLTAVEPATTEALIVRCADRIAAAGIKAESASDRPEA